MPAGKICYKCPEFFGSYNPHDPASVRYWFCRAGKTGDEKYQISATSALPAECPNKFNHALADAKAERGIPRIIE